MLEIKIIFKGSNLTNHVIVRQCFSINENETEDKTITKLKR